MNVHTFTPREHLRADDIRDRLWNVFPQQALSRETRAAFAIIALQERPEGRDWFFAPSWPVVLRDIVGRVKPNNRALRNAVEAVRVAVECWRPYAAPGETSIACAKVALFRFESDPVFRSIRYDRKDPDAEAAFKSAYGRRGKVRQ